MHRPQAQVREFHKLIDAPTSPAEPKLRNTELRAKLILEEALETVAALVGVSEAVRLLNGVVMPAADTEPSLIETIDGLCDTIVVCYGTAEDIGIDLEPFFDEVMRTNMQKGSGPVRADGKRMKPEGWKPPDLETVLKNELHRREIFARTNWPTVDSITPEQWRSMTRVEREAFDWFWSMTGMWWFRCLSCGFPTVGGRAVCDACADYPEIRFRGETCGDSPNLGGAK